MKELLTESVYFGMVLTLVCYEIGLAVKRKVKFPLANPLLVGAILIIGVLVALDIEYKAYQASVRPISFLLTPATVCLAIPLYRQLSLLKKYPLAIIGGVLSGVLTAMVSIYFLSRAFGLTHEEYVSILPKSITTAIGMGVSEKMGGVVALTVISISISGISGTILADIWLKLLRIREPIAKGLALGTAAHALGTAKAMELGEIEGAMSSLSIVVTGILSVIAISFFAPLI
ncbi:MAG: LrgB family protein [Lachnospiraceae bacterium]|nr:LrgB family protein [Lachnospiraceae bacterium]